MQPLQQKHTRTQIQTDTVREVHTQTRRGREREVCVFPNTQLRYSVPSCPPFPVYLLCVCARETYIYSSHGDESEQLLCCPPLNCPLVEERGMALDFPLDEIALVGVAVCTRSTPSLCRSLGDDRESERVMKRRALPSRGTLKKGGSKNDTYNLTSSLIQLHVGGNKETPAHTHTHKNVLLARKIDRMNRCRPTSQVGALPVCPILLLTYCLDAQVCLCLTHPKCR